MIPGFSRRQVEADERARGRHHDETIIAAALVKDGMPRSDALHAAANMVKRDEAAGKNLGLTVSCEIISKPA